MDKIKNGIIKNNVANGIIKNNGAMVNIDVIFAITLVIGAILVVNQMMPTISHEDRDWRIKQYMTVVRVTDILVQDDGESELEAKLKNGNYSGITKIGLAYIDNNKTVKKVLDIKKINALMGKGYKDNFTNTTWWEFPSSDINLTTRNTLAEMLGLSGYNFYMQLHPVGLSYFDSVPVQMNLSSKTINFDGVSIIDRYVYIVDPSITDKIKYLNYDNEAVHYRLNVWVW